MMRSIICLVLGVAGVAAGTNGVIVVQGTDASAALAVMGCLFTTFGFFGPLCFKTSEDRRQINPSALY